MSWTQNVMEITDNTSKIDPRQTHQDQSILSKCFSSEFYVNFSLTSLFSIAFHLIIRFAFEALLTQLTIKQQMLAFWTKRNIFVTGGVDLLLFVERHNWACNCWYIRGKRTMIQKFDPIFENQSWSGTEPVSLTVGMLCDRRWKRNWLRDRG
jgi:hypothetical protein